MSRQKVLVCISVVCTLINVPLTIRNVRLWGHNYDAGYAAGYAAAVDSVRAIPVSRIVFYPDSAYPPYVSFRVRRGIR